MGKWDTIRNSGAGEKDFCYFVRVRFADTDPMGVVYHARYLEWFEAARTELIRHKGISYKEIEEKGLSLPVIEAFCRYRHSVTYDELIRIETRLTDLDRLKLRMEYQVYGEQKPTLRVEGYTLHCFTNQQSKPVRAPKSLIQFFEKIQFCEPFNLKGGEDVKERAS
jgi:acyl-CoA thioester hydrolase